METEKPDQFDTFMPRREAASNDYIRGDAQGLSAMLTEQDPATFMPPGGAVLEGAAAVKTAQVEGATAFGPRSSGHFEVLNSASSGDLAFWTGWQIATMDIKGQNQPVPMALRTTEVFRLENGHWKLAHRHADIPAAPKD
ncbi:MAG: nuclear transport factor 2 family protein [Microbacteriaceae bacterium]